MKKAELDKFLQKSSKRKENIFTKYRDEILYMREQKATLATIINYLMTVDEEIKSRYADNENAGISFLSYSIKRFNGKEKSKNGGKNQNSSSNKSNDEVSLQSYINSKDEEKEEEQEEIKEVPKWQKQIEEADARKKL